MNPVTPLPPVSPSAAIACSPRSAAAASASPISQLRRAAAKSVALKELAPVTSVARADDAVTIVPVHHAYTAAVDEGLQRFLDEAALIRPIAHPNIVLVHDAFVGRDRSRSGRHGLAARCRRAHAAIIAPIHPIPTPQSPLARATG